MFPPIRSRRSVLAWLALAVVCAGPASARAQDTAKATSTTAPRVTLPAGTRIARPPVATPTITAAPSAGAQQQIVTVPDLAGRTVAEARRLLAAAGLELGRVAEGTGEGAPGTIVLQQPRAGSAVAAKSDVRLWLAPEGQTATRPPLNRPPPVTRPQEPERVTVPRLIGRTAQDARVVLAVAGLEVGEVAEVAGRGAPGTVVRQLPAAGSSVDPGSPVRLWVVPARAAQAPRDTLVRVPSLAGRTMEEARDALSAAGLRVGALAEAAGSGTPGTVARQQPAAGTGVAPGSPVRLWTVAARPPVQGGQVATRPDPPAPQPPVPQEPQPQNPQPQNPLPQNPQPQDTAAPPVVAPPVTVPVEPGAVPDVRRLPLRDARARLADAGFAAALDSALVDSAAWTVRAQQPGPGAALAPGGVVALLLDPPAAMVAGTTGSVPPAPGANGFQPSPAAAQPWFARKPVWITLVALLVVAAAAVGARRMRAAKRVLPLAGVSARLRMDAPARVAVEGDPFGAGRLRFRMNPGRTAARVSTAGPLFVHKEVSGD